MTDMPIIDLPPQITGTGPRGAIMARDIANARQAISGPAGRPPVTLEPLPFPFASRGGPTLPVDLYSLTPLSDYVKQLPAGDGIAGDPPRMFAGGTRDLPIITASGVDPQLLRWIPWFARHSAATIGDLTTIYTLIEEGDQLDLNTFQTRSGVEAYNAYKSRVWRWATAQPEPSQMSTADYTEWAVAQGWLPADTEQR